MEKIELTLYITGETPRSKKAITALQEICKGELEGKVELQIIDIQKSPELAEDEKIIATPTLVKTVPAPAIRIIGDLSDKEKVLLKLDLVLLGK